MKTPSKIEFGDFQTPPTLAGEVCGLLRRQGVEPETVLEPTCGIGAFLVAAAAAFPKARLAGWDINPAYVEQARLALSRAGAVSRAQIDASDFFAHDWDKELAATHGRVLVLGNLPWVTNAGVAAVNGSNLPAKRNLHGYRGMEARTGKSNFDISEWMLIRLVQALRGRSATVAMLCKTGTARKLLRFAWQNDGRVSQASLYRIDAKRHFDASVDACLLLVTTGQAGPAEAGVFDDLSATSQSGLIGLAGQDLVSDLSTYRQWRRLEGVCPYQWRSGVKHDCASVMELWRNADSSFRNKLGETVLLEPDYVFPLLKCSDLANGRVEPERFVLVTQRRVGQDTTGIATQAPRTWRYLESHRGRFDARKSSIYSGRVPFAVFGIGDYAFAPWKVAVSGLHRPPRFVMIGPVAGQPVLFDDTCYFLSFAEEAEARAVASVLNSDICQRFLASLTFTDAKRPVTVELLQRLNLGAIAEAAGLGDDFAASRKRAAREYAQPAVVQAEFVMDRPGKGG